MLRFPDPIQKTSRLIIAIAFMGSTLSSHAQQYLYGLTQKGGYYDKGVPYRIKTDGTEFVSYSDLDGQSGEKPGNGAGFLQIPGPYTVLSFLTEYGDQNQGYGFYLSVLANIGGLNGSAHRFDVGSNGSNPAGKLVRCADGSIAGMTSANGQFNGGAVFSTDATNPGFLRTLLAFDGAQKGRSPKGSLILGPDGKLFGMTELGGVNDKGVIFSVQKWGPNAKYQKLLDFDGAPRGSNPTGNLLLASDGKLYGMTRDGGTGGLGVVFRINTDGSGFMKLFDFDGAVSGSHPNGSLVQFTDGNLYGMTASGGANGFGTVFTITTAGIVNKVLDFDGTNGKSPLGDLLVEPTGTDLYGVTFSGGTYDQGVLFKLTAGSTFTKLYDYSSQTGSNPVGSLLMIRPTSALSFSPLSEKNTLSAPFTPEFNSPVLPVYFTSSDSTVAVIENNQVKIKGAGACFITAYQLGTHAFVGQTVSQMLIVKKATQTITFQPVGPKTYGDAPFALSATSSSGLPVSFSAFSNDVLSYDGTLWTIMAGGEVTVRAIQSGNDIYAEAIVADQRIVVKKAELVITFNPAASISCCQAFGLIATTASQEVVLFRSGDPDILSIIYGSSAYPNKAGQVQVIAYHPGNSRFKPAELARSITVQKSAQTIGFSLNNTTLKLGDLPVFTGSGSSSGLPVTYVSNPAGIAVAAGPYIFPVGVGTTTITATQAGNESFFAANPVSMTVTVTGPQNPTPVNTISWDNLTAKTIDDPPFNLVASASSGLPISYSSSNSSVAQVSGNLVTITGVGSTTINATQSGNAFFPSAASVSKVLTVDRAYQMISVVQLDYVNFGAPPLAMRKFTSAGLPITYSSSNESVASVDNYILYYKNGGSTTISAYQPGDARHQATQIVQQYLVVYNLQQGLVFDALPDKTYGDAQFQLIATASSGLPVTFASSNPSIAAINGNQVTIQGAGTVIITATANGNGYFPVQLSQSLVVLKAHQSIIFNGLSGKKYGDPAFTVSAVSSSNLPVTLTSSTPAVAKVGGNKVTITGNGTAAVVASQPGNASFEAAQPVTQSFAVTDAGNTYSMVGATNTGGPNYSGVVFTTNSDGSDFVLTKQYPIQTLPFFQAGLIKGTDGRLYGCSTAGGQNNAGQIIRLEADGSGLTSLYNFEFLTSGSSATSRLIQASDSYLYGVTGRGGSYGSGTIFRIKIDGSGFLVLYHFSEGTPAGGLIQANDGKLYGMMQTGGFFNNGILYRIDIDGSNFTKLFYFNDQAPYKTGAIPYGVLRQGPDGYLYGNLHYGGPSSGGTLFKIKTDGTAFARLIAFDGPNFGSEPGSSVLVGSDGKLYGMTRNGDANSYGTIFSVDLDGSHYARLLDFDGVNKGGLPIGELSEGSDGQLYGMTQQGGTNFIGTVFRIHKDGSGFQKLHDMDSSASWPLYGGLVESTPGNFFGTTFHGGANNAGVIFKVTSSGTFTVLTDFRQDVGSPASLVADATGEFYFGFTRTGGAQRNGTIFRINADGSSYQSLYDFPVSTTVNYLANRLFYISTGEVWCLASTPSGAGVIIRIKTDGTYLGTLSPFGSSSVGNFLWLVEGSDGWIFGNVSGSGYAASIYKIKNDGTGVTKVVDLPQGVGEITGTRLIRASDGNLYGTSTYNGIVYRVTEAGVYSTLFTMPTNIGQVPTIHELNGGSLGILMINGALYSIEKDGSAFTKVCDPPQFPHGMRVRDIDQTMDGWIYVVSDIGGVYDNGFIYKMRGDGTPVIVRDFSSQDGIFPNSLVFRKASQSFTFAPPPKLRVSDPPFMPVITTSSGAPVELVSSNPSVAIIEDGKIKPIGSGSVTITASLKANANFSAAPDIQQQLVVIGGQTITFTNPGDRELGSAPFALTATASSGLAVAYSSSSTRVSLVNEMVTLLEAGTVAIDANQAGNDDFDMAPTVSVSFCINPPKPGVMVSGPPASPILQSSNAEGNQWYRNGTAITGAAAATLAPSTMGSYSVTTTFNGCMSAMSDAVEVIVTGLDPELTIEVFPNPARDIINIELNSSVPLSAPVQLIDGRGTTFTGLQVSSGVPAQLDLRKAAQGLYLIKVEVNRKTYLFRVVKE